MKRFEGLESLRGIAALCVALFHVGFQTPFTDNRFVRTSHLMVDFFFVLSGFVIFHSYGQRLRDRKQLLAFTITRFGRVYPLHLLMLLVFLGIEVLKFVVARSTTAVPARAAFSVNNLAAFVTNLFLVQALGFHDDETFNYPSWSISTEFFTYLLFALVLYLLRNRVQTAARGVAPVLSALAFGFLYFVVGSLTRTVDFGLVRCIGGFFLGVFAYQVYLGIHRTRPAGSGLLDALALLAAVAIVALMSSPLSNHQRFLLPPLFALLVVAVAALGEGSRIDRILRARPLVWLGERSYSVYMMHAALIWTTTQILRFALHVPVKTVRQGQIMLLTDAATGTAALVAYLAALLVVSNWTFWSVEDRYRTRSRAIAQRVVGRLTAS